MILRLRPFLMGLFALIATALLALAPAQAKLAVGLDQSTQKSALGGYQLFEQVESGIESLIHLASLGNFGWSAETASDYANAPNRTLTPNEISGASLPDLPTGYHYRSVGGEVQVVRNPGQAGNLPPMHLEGGQLVPGPKPGVVRSTATRSAFLRNLANNDKIPSNIRPWLLRGEVPPGYTVHHRKALFDGGTDTVDNMVLQGVDLHRITHRFYRPGGQVPTINPPPANPH